MLSHISTKGVGGGGSGGDESKEVKRNKSFLVISISF